MKNLLLAILLIIIWAAILIGIAALVGNDDEKPRDEASRAYFAAYKFCERYAPSGKNFVSASGGDVLDGRAEWIPDRKDWFAAGYVDAQNKYGAMRHQRWAAHVVHANGNWKLTFLEIGGEMFVEKD